MEELWMRFAHSMVDRVSGPMHLRLVLQPAMAVFFAVIDGLKDAKVGNEPYFWSLFTDREHRMEMIKDGWESIGKVFCLAFLLDVIYQFIETRFVYPGESIIVAILLAIVPYLTLRGLVTRIARKSKRHV